jgi:biopolymer transport protein ExbD
MLISRKSSGHQRAVDLTPMIDVVFLLIIFFMLTSHLGDLRRTEIDLPHEPGEEQRSQQEAAMIVDIDVDGSYFVESVRVDLNEVQRLALAGLESESSSENFDVLIRPDRFAPAVHLDQLLNRLAKVGVTRWKMGTYGLDDSGAGS